MERRILFALLVAVAGTACDAAAAPRCDRPGAIAADHQEIDLCVRIVNSFSWQASGGRIGAELDCEAGCELAMSMQSDSGGALLSTFGAWQPALTLHRSELADPGTRRLLFSLRDERGQDAHAAEDLAWLSPSLERPQRQQILRVGNQYLELKLQSLEPL